MKAFLLLALCLGTAAGQGAAKETAAATSSKAVAPGPGKEDGTDSAGINSKVSNFPFDMEPRWRPRGRGCRRCPAGTRCRYTRHGAVCSRVGGIRGTCSQPPIRGNCRGVIRRWYYDYASGRCRRFNYSGCGGNDNRFVSLRACRRTCRRRSGTWDNRSWDINTFDNRRTGGPRWDFRSGYGDGYGSVWDTGYGDHGYDWVDPHYEMYDRPVYP